MERTNKKASALIHTLSLKAKLKIYAIKAKLSISLILFVKIKPSSTFVIIVGNKPSLNLREIQSIHHPKQHLGQSNTPLKSQKIQFKNQIVK